MNELYEKFQEIINNKNQPKVTDYVKDELRTLKRTTSNIIDIMHIFATFSLCEKSINNTITYNNLELFTDATFAIHFLIEKGTHYTIIRELRYILESIVKYYYIDTIYGDLTIEEKIDKYDSLVNRSSIDECDDILIPSYKDETNIAFINNIKNIYKKQCCYVHPSKKQIFEYENRKRRNAEMGFEGNKEIRNLASLLNQTYEIVVILLISLFKYYGDEFLNIIIENKVNLGDAKYLKCLFEK